MTDLCTFSNGLFDEGLALLKVVRQVGGGAYLTNCLELGSIHCLVGIRKGRSDCFDHVCDIVHCF